MHFKVHMKRPDRKWDFHAKEDIQEVQRFSPCVRIYLTKSEVKFIENRDKKGVDRKSKTTIYNVLIYGYLTRVRSGESFFRLGGLYRCNHQLDQIC